MDDMNRDEFGKMLREAWVSVLLGVLVVAAIVFGIFQSSKLSYQKELERLEIQRARAEMAISPSIAVWTWQNLPESYNGRVLTEYRDLAKLEPGTEYIVGQLREFERNLPCSAVHNHYQPDVMDDPRYFDPVITVYWDGFVQAESSLAGGWLKVSPTEKGKKTGEYYYLPTGKISQDNFGEGAVSIVIPVNGADNLREANGGANFVETQKLGEVYGGIPAEYSDREREVWSYQLTVTAYNQDPRDKRSKNAKPAAKLILQVRRYCEWNLNEEEFDACGIGDYNFTPHTTVEVIANGKA